VVVQLDPEFLKKQAAGWRMILERRQRHYVSTFLETSSDLNDSLRFF
jgi:hypothetical protein